MSARNPELNEGLLRALSEIGEPATPAELQALGITRLRRVSREVVSKLIEKAVNRTLLERTIGPPQEDLGVLVSRAYDVFQEIAGTHEEIERTRKQVGEQRLALKEELARLRADLGARRGFVETDGRLDVARREQEENDRLGTAVRAAFARLASVPPELRRVEREVIVRTLEVLEAARATALEAGRARAGVEIQVLERRVAKLVHSLETTDAALERLARTKDLDAGLESIYRTVQGLDPGEHSADLKRNLMVEIFQRNLELRRGFDGQSASPPG